MNIPGLVAAHQMTTRNIKGGGGQPPEPNWKEDVMWPCLTALLVVAFGIGVIYSMFRLPEKPDTPSPTAPHRMKVIDSFFAGSSSMNIVRDRETGEDYMINSSGGIVHLVKPSTTPKP